MGLCGECGISRIFHSLAFARTKTEWRSGACCDFSAGMYGRQFSRKPCAKFLAEYFSQIAIIKVGLKEAGLPIAARSFRLGAHAIADMLSLTTAMAYKFFPI